MIQPRTQPLPKTAKRYEMTGEAGLPKVKAWRCQDADCRHVWRNERSQVECPKCGSDDVCVAPMSMQVAS